MKNVQIHPNAGKLINGFLVVTEWLVVEYMDKRPVRQKVVNSMDAAREAMKVFKDWRDC